MNRQATLWWSGSLVLALLALVTLLTRTERDRAREGGREENAPRASASPSGEGLEPVPESERRSTAGEERSESSGAPAVVRGHVASAVGEWWRGASVYAVTSSKRGAQARVDEDGRFALELTLPSAECRDSVTLTLDTIDGRRLRQEATFGPDPEEPGRCVAEVVFTLPERCGVRGIVLDQAGTPLEGVLAAAIQLSSSDHSYVVLAEEKTDREGRYELDFEPKEGVLLALVHREFQPGALPLGFLMEHLLELGPTVLVRGAVIEGTLRANAVEARFLAGLRVTARGPQGRVILLGSGLEGFMLSLDAGKLRHWIVSSALDAGRFRLPGLETDSHTLELGREEGYSSLPGSVNAGLKVDAPAVLEFDPASPQLWFRVTDAVDARPLRARVTILGAFGELAFPTDREGVALLMPQAESAYRVLIEAAGHARRELDLQSPSANGVHLEEAALEPLGAGRLDVTLSRPWSGGGRIELELQGDAHTTVHEVEVAEGVLGLADLAPGFYWARLSLWGAAERGTDGSAEDVVLSFDFRIQPQQATALSLAVR